ncbi:ABC transporter ATP-binding protein [Streptomyces sp. NBC_00094]|uniref:ABC transporter ATP-binding protein n=1 Tax=Streptomyces sp. NBC_00094 TaxID=2903620 RepID=UPI002254583A|nr:ABC transporter ATP-binding protein [Streptomyces sp. NBC_00094]MCX5389096.1 ABC transporter ATP-binding protein [Streptomyces sp. NBC_00094]
MPRAISLHHVSKAYEPGVRVVDDLSLDIEPGEFLVLLGPSGCGKSTVLRLVAGLEDITEGELRLDGQYANHVPARERDMAMVFQSFALYPRMTSSQNIGFPLQMRGLGEESAPRINAAAELLGIKDTLDRYPGQLSGGERQRVAMGRAICREPSAFLMDEPLSNLDAKLRGRLRAEIARLTRDLGVTTVYVTHDQSEAMSLGDRIAVMRDGVLQQIATPREAYALPANVFVAAFIGTPRINLLEAVVHAPPGGGMTIELGHQRLPLTEPLSRDHQLLRVQQGRPVIIGLRSEAIRIAHPRHARLHEVPAEGVVEHVEYQGHEGLVHVRTGARPALVPALEAARHRDVHSGRAGRAPGAMRRLRTYAREWKHGPRTDSSASVSGTRPTLTSPDSPQLPTADLVVRTNAEFDIRVGTRVPLLIDLDRLYVFDHQGRRICPAPDSAYDFAY